MIFDHRHNAEMRTTYGLVLLVARSPPRVRLGKRTRSSRAGTHTVARHTTPGCPDIVGEPWRSGQKFGHAGVMITALALAHAATPPFNGTFYATMAAVIPVLFLAIAAQGSAYWDFMYKTKAGAALEDLDLTLVALPVYRGCLSVIFTLISLSVPIAGVIGEIAAVLALDDRAAAPGTETPVLTAAIYLLITAAIGTVLQFFTGSEGTHQTEAKPSAKPARARRRPLPHPSATRTSSASQSTGKTDDG